MPRFTLPTRAAWRLPASVVNGLSIGVGLLLGTGLIAQFAGQMAAAAAASGFGAVCVADNVCPPRAKLSAMLPAALGSFATAVLVALARHHAGWMAATVLFVTFTALLWTAWGKRGLPQSFAMILSMVFQMAAFSEGHMSPPEVAQHLGWVAIGSAMMVAWSCFTAFALAGRYRTLALADSLGNLARLIGTQVRWTRDQAAAATPASAGDPIQTKVARTPTDNSHLLSLIRQQAGLADIFQSARDQLYSEADRPQDPVHRQIDALIQVINLRDVVLACQLDIDQVKTLPGANEALRQLACYLGWHAEHVRVLAEALRLGRPLPQASSAAESPPALPDTHPDTRLQALARRALHLHEHRLALDAALNGHAHDPHPEAEQLHTFVSPTAWSLAPLRRELRLGSPVMRYALRTTLAMACALAISHALPWRSHPHWLLMTVAVVMRGNLEQTLARRNARVLGTVVGCALVSLLLAARPDAALLFVVLALAQSLAHGFVQRDYRITTAAGAVMALIQAHLFAHGAQAAWLDVAVRLADTLIGAGIAWGFSYVLPSWERAQLPALVARLRRAQLDYAHQVLRWHEQHPHTPQRNHARREVYDALWLLAQALQRTDTEPAYARSWSPQLETMLIRSHRLISQLASVRILLTRRLSHLEPETTRSALQHTDVALALSLGQTSVTTASPPDPAPDTPDVAYDLPSPVGDPTPWLQRRLRHIEAEAQAWSQAAAGIAP